MNSRMQSRVFPKSLRKAFAFVLTAAVVAVVGLVASGYGGLGASLKPKRTVSESSILLGTQDKRPRKQVSTETVTLRPSGFEPQAISRSVGRFVLSVENYTGLDVVSLRLKREGDSFVHEAPLSRGQYDWNELIDLPPGRYALTEATHPDWVCWITIAGP